MDNGYTLFIVSLTLFMGSHMLLGRPAVRRKLAGMMGERPYLIAHSLLSIALLGWLIVEAANAPKDYLWPWIYQLSWIPNIFMPLAFVLLVAGMTTPNPLSIIAPKEPFDPQRPGLAVAITRHPVLLAFALWSTAHLFPNGELALVLMFGTFAGFALLGMKLIDRKRKREMGEQKWLRLSSHTSNMPFSTWIRRRTKPSFGRRDAAGIAGGLALYLFFFYFHEIFFGKVPFPPLPW